MSATEGFWPGDAPAQEEQVQQPEPPVADPPGWPQPADEQPAPESSADPEPEAAAVAESVEAEAEAEPEPAVEDEEAAVAEEPAVATAVHVPGELDIPDGVNVLEGSPSGAERTVGVVVSRFNGEISNRLLESALAALSAAGVQEERITVMPVPGAFELPIGAMALAKTRRYSCVIALGCVVRGETAHFDYVAGEAASGIQLAGLETGVPVAFGVLTVDTAEQAEARVDRGADAARAALEMADLFAQVREQAKSG
ncbi:MAG TPA: 6,7-dimethyl-8-ribityllumazine synthase [Gaiellaceae bacterium]|nr:6,7-dimethyl-8-ribityllumazine synthase [Gaiellaceae bacterium]